MSAIERFIEDMGLIYQESGGPRIAGRIFALLLVRGKAMSLQDISQELDVSRASVSTNARQLAQRGVLRLTSHAGDRQDYYEITPFPYFDMLGDISQQFRRQGKMVRTSADAIASEDEAVAARVADLSQFYEKSAEILEHWAEALRQEQAPRKDSK